MKVQITDKDSLGKIFWRDLIIDGETVSDIDFANRFISYYKNLFIAGVETKLVNI